MRAAILLALAVAVAIGGCSSSESEPAGDLSPLVGTMVSPRTVHVLPGRNWTAVGEVWRFQDDTALPVVVARAPRGPLRIELVPHPRSQSQRFLATWDGAPVDAWREVNGSWRAAIPPSAASVGHHRLELRRLWAEEEPGGDRHTLLTEVRWGVAALADRLSPVRAPRETALRDFLVRGVVGEGPQLRGGILFDGPGHTGLEIAPGEGARLHAVVENLSARPAAFSVRMGAASLAREVAAGGRETIEVPLPPSGRLELTAEGAADGLFLWGEPFVSRETARRAPAIVLVTLDTTRRDALGPYGGDPAATPALSAFAAGATVFTRAWSTTSWTLPSHSSIMTGLYPSEHGAGLATEALPPARDTLAERLSRAGYFTVGFAGGFLLHHRFGVAQGFHAWRDPDGFESDGGSLVAAVEERLDGFAGRPPFLFVNLFDPHAPYLAPEPLRAARGVDALAASFADDPVWGTFAAGTIRPWNEIIERRAPADAARLAWIRAAYDAEVAWADDRLGALFAALRRHGLYDDALIVVTADHGELLGEGGWFSHSHRLDPELGAVPLIVKWPGQTEGTRVDDLVSLVDLFPTILRTAGAPIPPQSGLLLGPRGGGQLARRDRVFLEEHESKFHPLFAAMKVAPSLYAVQERETRTVVWEGGRECARQEAGRWLSIPCPADAPSVDDVVRQLGSAVTLDPAAAGSGLTDEEREGLAALGYL